MTTEADLFELPERYVALQREARALAADCADLAARADEADRLDPDVRRRLAASGSARSSWRGSSAAGTSRSTRSR